jgi:hypothetical protein
MVCRALDSLIGVEYSRLLFVVHAEQERDHGICTWLRQHFGKRAEIVVQQSP